jgi:hypothetical protein
VVCGQSGHEGDTNISDFVLNAALLSPRVLQGDRTATAPSLDAMPVQAMSPGEQRACQRVRHELPRDFGRKTWYST